MRFVSWNDEFDTVQLNKYLLSIHYVSLLSMVIFKTGILLLKRKNLALSHGCSQHFLEVYGKFSKVVLKVTQILFFLNLFWYSFSTFFPNATSIPGIVSSNGGCSRWRKNVAISYFHFTENSLFLLQFQFLKPSHAV